MAATQGHTQSLHTNGLDEAIALPTDFSARIARNTQLLLQQESGTTRVIDPWGGSHYVERLTYELAEKALEHIKEVEELGGMAKAIDAGIPKMRIEEAAARTQARIDTGKQTITGVNKFKIDGDAKINLLKVDNNAVREAQIAKLKRLRAERNEPECQAALTALTEGAKGTANLLDLCVKAARAKATVGEMSEAMEKVFTRHRAEIRAISGVYRSEASMSSDVVKAQKLVEEFEKRRPPPAHPHRQARPGRPRPRPEGHRHRLRRPRLRRRHRTAVRHRRRSRPSGRRERRPRRRRLLARRRPPHACP